jgi:AraC-like DNA-binding protein
MSELIHIKNMVCNRCIMAVETVFSEMNIPVDFVELGKVQVPSKLDEALKEELKSKLDQLGFELLEDKKEQVVEQVKNLIIELVHHRSNELNVNLSDYIAGQLQLDYSNVSKLFSELEGTTIEKFFIVQKIERVKELISYDEKNLSEIAFELHYSSAAHLSSQFKKITGLTPSQYKNLKHPPRSPLSDL